MANYVIYTNTVIYMALYLKRQYVPKGTLSIPKKDLDNYYRSVLNSIDKGRRRAPFTYEVIQGEPQYNINVAGPEIRQKFANARFGYDKNRDVYFTNSKADELEMKSIGMIPLSLRPFFISEENKKTLGIGRGGVSKQGGDPDRL